MSLHRYTTNVGSSGAAGSESLAAATAETLIQYLTPATRKGAVVEISLSANSVTASEVPLAAEWCVQTSAGTGTSVTPDPDDPGMPAALITAQHHFTAEPTTTTVRRSWFVPVVGGLFDYQLPLDREIIMPVSARQALRATSPQTNTVRGFCVHEE